MLASGGAARPPSLMDPDEVTLAALMAEAGRILGSSLDSAATLSQIAELIVPGVADWCAIDLLAPDGTLTQVAIAHRDPERLLLVDELRRRYPADPDANIGAYAVARSGTPMMLSVIDAEVVKAIARNEEHRRLIEEVGLSSWMCAPMTAGGRVLGTIGFAGAESGRTFGPRHLAFAADLATRAGAAIENARAFHVADRFRQILDAVAEAVFVLDPGADTIQGINQGASELLGRTLANGGNHHVRPRRRPARPGRSGHRGRGRGRSEARTVPLRFRRPGAASVPAEVLLQRVELPGEPPTAVAIARDVRERHEVQGRLKRLAEAEHARAAELNAVIRAMGEGVIVCGPDGKTILANPAGRTMFPEATDRGYDGILAELRDPDLLAPALGTHAGPVVLRTRGSPSVGSRSRPIPWRNPGPRPRAERRDDPRPARRDGAAPARGGPGDVHRRALARAAHAGDDDLRRGAGAVTRRQRPRRRRPGARSSRMSPTRRSDSSGSSRTSSR